MCTHTTEHAEKQREPAGHADHGVVAAAEAGEARMRAARELESAGSGRDADAVEQVRARLLANGHRNGIVVLRARELRERFCDRERAAGHVGRLLHDERSGYCEPCARRVRGQSLARFPFA